MKELKELERVLKALANRRRLAILGFLKRENEATVSEAASAINLSIRSTSKHLLLLLSANIVQKDQRGLHAHYKVISAQPPVIQIILSLV